MIETKQGVIISGNPIDGLTVWGPFNSCENGFNWARENLKTEWWWAILENPNLPHYYLKR